MISSPLTHIEYTLLEKHYSKHIVQYSIQESKEPEESTLKYNYITTEKFIEQSLLKHQDILQ